MELKNAVTVGLISLFSATIVVLIARALDNQAASRLEPHLVKIAAELEAIRARGGGVAAASGEGATIPTRDDVLMVYYFHGVRCPTCRAAEANAHEALETDYARQLATGELAWEVLDYTADPEAKAMAEQFGVISASIVLVEMRDGQVERWNRLDKTLALAEDPRAMAAYLHEEIDRMLEADAPPASSASDRRRPADPRSTIPAAGDVPETDRTTEEPPPIPIPQ